MDPTSPMPFGMLGSPGAAPGLNPAMLAGWAANYMNKAGGPLNPADPAQPSAPGILNGAAPPAMGAGAANPLAGQMTAGNSLAQMGMKMMQGPAAPAPLPPIQMARPVGPGQGIDPSRLLAAMRGMPIPGDPASAAPAAPAGPRPFGWPPNIPGLTF